MLERKLRRFAADEDGAILAFVIVLFLMMVVITGMAIDFMRHETARADIQNALDRGVLAAAHLDQTANNAGTKAEREALTKQMINEYMASRSFKVDIRDLEVEEIAFGEDGKQFVASANYRLDTFFLKILGMNTMVVPASASASQYKTDLEVSLILDVSGSMDRESDTTPGKKKIAHLKEAAIEFVGYLIDDPLTDPVELTADRTLVSIIPYNAQVVAPEWLANELSLSTHFSRAYCFDFQPTDFDRVDMVGQSFQQVKNFMEEDSGLLHCSGNNEILAYSNSFSELQTHINGLSADGWTATYNGVKWGAGLLDDSAQSLVDQRIASGDLPNTFTGWPRRWDTPGVNKVIVIMTDGRNTRLYDIPDETYYSRVLGDPDTDEDDDLDYYETSWEYSSDDRELLIHNTRDADPITGFGPGDDRMHRICNAIKAESQNAMIFTIGFELGDNDEGTTAANSLAVCGSSTDRNYAVEGVQISKAFKEILQSIELLRLANYSADDGTDLSGETEVQ